MIDLEKVTCIYKCRCSDALIGAHYVPKRQSVHTQDIVAHANFVSMLLVTSRTLLKSCNSKFLMNCPCYLNPLLGLYVCNSFKKYVILLKHWAAFCLETIWIKYACKTVCPVELGYIFHMMSLIVLKCCAVTDSDRAKRYHPGGDSGRGAPGLYGPRPKWGCRPHLAH